MAAQVFCFTGFLDFEAMQMYTYYLFQEFQSLGKDVEQVRVVIIIIALLFAVYLLLAAFAFIVVGEVFGRYRSKKKRKKQSQKKTEGQQSERQHWLPSVEANAEGKSYIESLGTAKQLEIVSDDGLRLRALYLPAEKPSGKICLAFHGHHSTNLRNVAMFARYYHEQGFELIMPDLRGHGESEGKWLGFSYLDGHDIVLWAKYALELFGSDSKILLHGVSMGAASVICASAQEDLPKQVRGAVSDCAFSSAKQQFKDKLWLHSRLSSLIVVPLIDLMCRIRVGYSLGDAEPQRFMKKARVPFLIIHGDKDDYVLTPMALALDAACPTEHRLLIFKGAFHACAYPSDKSRYERELNEFIARCGI